MKLKKVNMFQTPKNMGHLQSYLGTYLGSEALVASTCAWMTWNLACEVTMQATYILIQTYGTPTGSWMIVDPETMSPDDVISVMKQQLLPKGQEYIKVADLPDTLKKELNNK